MNSREKYFNTINFDMYSAQWSHGPVVVRWPIEDTVPTFLYRAIIFIFFSFEFSSAGIKICVWIKPV